MRRTVGTSGPEGHGFADGNGGVRRWEKAPSKSLPVPRLVIVVVV